MFRKYKFYLRLLCHIHTVTSIVLISFVVLGRVIEEIGLKAMEHSLILMPVLLTSLKDNDVVVARKSIIAGTHIFCSVLEELALQVSAPPQSAYMCRLSYLMLKQFWLFLF